MATTKYRQMIIGKHPREGWLTLDIGLAESDGPVTLTDHTTAEHAERFSASGAYWYRKDSPDCHTAGQMLDALLDPDVRPVAPWTRADLLALHHVWRRWHLNDMQAACEHMRDHLPEDPSYDARRDITCDVTGYQYGRAWLVEPITADERDEITRLLALAAQSERFGS